MTSEIDAVPCIMKVVERSYCTEPGWRLATFQEANDYREMIKQQGLLKGRQRVMASESGPARSIYEDVTLTPKGRNVALLLCAFDWNYEVVYWLLNYWVKGDSFNSLDVRQGNIPLMDRTTFVEMSRMTCNLGRILGEEGLAIQKVETRVLSQDSVEEVMVSMGKSCWGKFSREHKKILGQTFLGTINAITSDMIWQCSEVKWFQDFASQEDTPNIWNFLWYYISFNAVAGIVHKCFSLLIKDLGSEKCWPRSQRDFFMSTAILHYILEYEKDQEEGILERACKDAAGNDRQRFNNTLKNRSSAFYDKTICNMRGLCIWSCRIAFEPIFETSYYSGGHFVEDSCATGIIAIRYDKFQDDKFEFSGHSQFGTIRKGEKKYQEIKKMVDLLNSDKKLDKKLFSTLKNKIIKWWPVIKKENNAANAKEEDSVCKFLNQYDAKYHHIYRLLAAMESSYMFKSKDQQSQSEIDSRIEGNVPSILTVQYNAWKYRNESEALAGIAVEITKEMEGIMTDAQWLSTCLRNTWRNQKQVIWIEIIFPCILAALLAISFTWILWLMLDKYKLKDSIELKYSSLPLTIIIIVWTLVKKVICNVHPVSVQLKDYIKLPDHAEKLGYQERVISDITFLKEEISKKPYSLCSVVSYIWHCMTQSCIISLLPSKNHGDILARSIPSANLRIVVFVDDLDRCQESVILQVLSAINLVLAVCKINVILGMDKAILHRAIMKKYGEKSSEHNKK
ncbi:hypothetical protein SUGI_1260620 [Cryptomeria japonica]|uniref:KAP NTPase domain-containing protein n=1 Tax=Cryptomeria japonica TaxID=3369 RepID=A0AAD3NQI4_CRYJA|nr:hypothetical protein SUGI_1260620 [Cryptomeria japonica]